MTKVTSTYAITRQRHSATAEQPSALALVCGPGR